MTPGGNAAGVKQGDRVLYVPHEDHHLDADRNGDPVWEFEHARDGPGRRKGDTARRLGRLSRDGGGTLLTEVGNHPVRPVRPLRPWGATVRAAHEDGTADLDVSHPNGCATLHYDRVPRGDPCRPHSFHTPEEA